MIALVDGPLWIAVCGSGQASGDDVAAKAVGAAIAEAKAVLVCGGLGGVMEAACKGAREKEGTTVGLLPQDKRDKVNPFVDIAVPTGLGGLGRSVLIVRAAHAVIAIGGDYGTLSEITLALKARTPVVGLDTWKLTRAGAQEEDATIIRATNAVDAVSAALSAAAARH
jgi:uncharacterized protein (TIGR00725 family)